MAIKRLEIKTILKNYDNNVLSTFYLFEPDEKYIIPVEVPHVKADLIKKFLRLAGMEVNSLIVYHQCRGRLFCFLTFSKDDILHKIECPIHEALNLCRAVQVPIYATEEIIKQCGIKITRKLIENSLEIGS